ncbi:MAG: PP2C family protein-serine/threonine phosphatase [Bacteroidota bacterium]|nr:PP2C family protein-serine/threonine phosphatase [Bacteroidota bacterium]
MSWFSSLIKSKERKFNGFEYAIVSEKSSRDDMEDAFYCSGTMNKNQFFVGIYDGHGGALAAQIAKDKLHTYFVEQIKSGKEPNLAFHNAYQNVSGEITNRFCGTTAATVFFEGLIINYAHVGDTRIILINQDGIKNLTIDHRVGNPVEEARVFSLGAKIKDGYISKGFTGITPTRALGDAFFADVGIISSPETGEYTIADKDKWLIIGTDGLFDFATDEEILQTLNNSKSAEECAQAIKKLVLEKNEGDDNLTFFIMKLFKPENK